MQKHICSFCGEKKYTVEGQDGFICSDCCNICKEEFGTVGNIRKGVANANPFQLKEELDKYVIGQEEAKILLSVAVCNHIKRIKTKNDNLEKSNILILGPTGCGKTYLMSTIASILDIPMVIVDSTNYTQVGYVGDDVSSILKNLYVKSGYNMERCKTGIVYVDEIDKIMTKVSSVGDRDAAGTGVQQNFLKMMEGGVQTFKIAQEGGMTEVSMDTKNILFVFGGAFVGIDKVNTPEKHIGFTESTVTQTEQKGITQEDIVKYGFIPEFIGRIPIVVQMHALTRENMRGILVDMPRSVLTQYKELFALDNIKATFDESLINGILDHTMEKKMGARGLRGAIEKDMMKLMFEASKHGGSKRITITRDLLDHPDQYEKLSKPLMDNAPVKIDPTSRRKKKPASEPATFALAN